jgi:hypothetical protein
MDNPADGGDCGVMIISAARKLIRTRYVEFMDD